MNNWIVIENKVDEDAGKTTTTEALELPHGCLVRVMVQIHSKSIVIPSLKNGLTVALTFVPNVKLERYQDMVEFKHKP